MKIKTINQIASTKTLTDKYGICSDENGNANSFALADIVEPINNLKNEVGKIKVNGSGIESISYPELVALRNENKLAPGQMYRIIDYVTTTTQDKTKSANHPFDIIVTALNENTLDEKASAIAHEEDTYFDGNDLSAWELWYDLDNDTDKYEWADATNGKGVIYRMIDEKRNDCPYDFKNILFYNYKYTDSTTTDKYYFTFSYVVSGVLYDGTVEKQVDKCYGNEMGVYIKSKKKSLNINVFRNRDFNNHCYSNTFGIYCYSNTFGSYCRFNIFGDFCYTNTFGNHCYSNTFGSYCYSNTFGNSCYSNTFGISCYSNTFGSYLEYRKIDSRKTSITNNDEYYDDGSGQLVPIKHPDLSTQPSILPYKFMGQYVYEVLLPIPEIELIESFYYVDAQCLVNSIKSLHAIAILQAEELLFCKNKATVDDSKIPMFHRRCVNISTIEQYGGTGRYAFEVKPNTQEYQPYIHITNAYLRLVYTSMPENDTNYYYETSSKNTTEYLTIKSLEDNNEVSFTNDIMYLPEGSNTWSTLNGGEKLILNKSQEVKFKKNNPLITTYGIGTFRSTGRFNVSGNIMSMLYGDDFIGKIDLSDKNYPFSYLFNNCTELVDASELILPAKILADSCYYYMFGSCTSLTSAPELPATTLTNNCYQGMFAGCTSLTTAPELPATTLVNSCYYAMFFGCSKLSGIKMLATDRSASYCLENWVYGVASTGTFIKTKKMNSLPTGTSGMPSGWTIKNI